jgi:Dirigent-like protein
MYDIRTRRHAAVAQVRRHGAIATIAVAVLAGGAITAASASTPSTHASTHGSQILQFGVSFSPFNVIDVPPLQRTDGDFQAGDYAVFSDVLTNRAGKNVGTEGGSGLITKVSAGGAQIYFSLAIKLPHGQVVASGLASTAPHKRLAIVGGTGAYSGARGRIDLVEKGDGTGTLKLTLR